MNGCNLKTSNFGLRSRGAIGAGRKPSASASAPITAPRISQWQIEREKLLLRLCRLMLTRVQGGQSISKAAREVSRRWNGRHYKCEPTRRIQLSASSFAAHFSRWQKDQRIESFRLAYKGPTAKKVPPAFIREVARRAQAPEVYSWQSILRSMQADMNRGKRIPGLPKKLNRFGSLPSTRTAYRFFAGIDLGERRSIRASIARSTLRLLEIDRAIKNRAMLRT